MFCTPPRVLFIYISTRRLLMCAENDYDDTSSFFLFTRNAEGVALIMNSSDTIVR